MWLLFLQCVIMCSLLLIVPGLVALRVFRLRFAECLLFAPIASVALLEVLAILFSIIELTLNIVDILLVVVLIAALAIALVHIFHLPSEHVSLLKGSSRSIFASIGTYCIFAVVLAVVFYVMPLDGPSSFNQDHDNVLHLNLIKVFSQTGGMSPLHVSAYATSNVLPYYVNGAFYPAAWHMVAALSSMMLNAEPTVAANAMNTTILALVLPLSFCAFMQAIFGGKQKIVMLGSLCFAAFASFPWSFLTFGPLYPNLFGMALCPMFAALFIALFPSWFFESKKNMCCSLFLLAMGLFTLLFAHTNAIFSAAIILIPYVSHVIVSSDKCTLSHSPKKYFVLIAFLAVVAIIWLVVSKLPFVSGVTSFSWPATTDLLGAVSEVLLGSYNGIVQSVLASIVVLAVLTCLANKDYRWLSGSWLFSASLFVIAVGTEGWLKQTLTGFWYTDPYRLAATIAIPCVPLLSLGLLTVLRQLSNLFGNAKSSYAAVIAAAVCFCFVVYWPVFNQQGEPNSGSAFSIIQNKLEKLNSTSLPNVLAPEERRFLSKVKSVVGDSMVLNCPEDGSFFAYSVGDINTYFRSPGFTDRDNLTEDARYIKNQLYDIEQNDSVRQAVADVNAQYVMLLDYGGEITADRHTYGYYDPGEWKGFNQIADDTPGFEVVLSEGDMRLYRIVD